MAINPDKIANIEEYGASTGAADNSAAIQSALDSGLNVFIPEGVWKITSNLDVDTNTDGQVIFGEGPKSVIQLDTGGSNARIIDVNGNADTDRVVGVIIKDLWLRGHTYDNTPVEPSGSFSDLAVRFHNTYKSEIRNCWISNNTGHAVFLEDARATTITNNMFFDQYYAESDGWTYGGGSDIYTKDGEEGIIISDNHFLSNTKSNIFTSSNGDVTGVTITNNIFTPMDSNGDLVDDGNLEVIHHVTYFYGGEASVVGQKCRMAIGNNIFHNSLWASVYATGSNNSPANTGPRVVINDNVVARAGIDHTSGDDPLQGGIVCMAMREISITGNLVLDYEGYSSTDLGYTAYGAIQLRQQYLGGDFTIANNIIKDSNVAGIYIGNYNTGGLVTGNVILGCGQRVDENVDGITVYSTQTKPAEVTGIAATQADNTFTKTSHGYTDGDPIIFNGTMPAGIDDEVIYYVINSTTNDFQVSREVGDSGSVHSFTADGTVDANILWDIGGMVISNNFVQARGDGVSYVVTGQERPAVIAGNYCENIRQDSRAGNGIYYNGPIAVGGIVRDNVTFNYSSAIHFPMTFSGRLVDEWLIDGNLLYDCGYGVRASTDGSGLILVTNLKVITGTNRIKDAETVSTPLVEGVQLGENIQVMLDAAPVFGTWRQGDYIRNRTWDGTASDPIGWQKTDSGEDLHSASTFTALALNAT